MRSLQTEKVILLIVAVLIAGLFIGRTFLPYTGYATTTLKSNLTGKYVPGEMIIKFKTGDVVTLPSQDFVEYKVKQVKINKDSVSSLNNKYKLSKIRKFSDSKMDKKNVFDKVYKFKFPANADVPIIAGEYANDANVEYAIANFIGVPDQVTPITVNDPRFPEQWNFKADKLNGPLAWAYEDGSSNPVIIGVVDSGINYNHPDLAANYIGGYDYRFDQPDPMDYCGHGTSVAGIVAAQINNNEGVAGGCPNCKFYAAKMAGSECDTDLESVSRAIAGAADAGAKVISVSWGFQCHDCSLRNLLLYGELCIPVHCEPVVDGVRHAVNSGAIVVASAGNDGKGDWFQDPASITILEPPRTGPRGEVVSTGANAVLAVGATDQQDGRANGPCSNCRTGWWWSNFGSQLEVSAPGIGLISTDKDGVSYGGFGGTSGAAPHVSALAGLIWAKRPDLSNYDVSRLIMQSVDPINAGVYMGTGRVNYAKAMGALDYNVLASMPAYDNTIQRCCVENVNQLMSWNSTISTTDYSSLISDPAAITCVNWNNYCSEWNTYNLPSDQFDNRQCKNYILRFLPSGEVHKVSRLTPIEYKGLTADLNFIWPYDALASIEYKLRPTQRNYQWDLSCCGGTIDVDKDGYYADDKCSFAKDCRDDYAYVSPESFEYCGNSVDENCNGLIDELGCIVGVPPGYNQGGGGSGGTKPFYIV